MGKDVIIACDFPSPEECLSFLKPFEGKRLYLKVGMELYYAGGNTLIQALKKQGHRLFLDLKLHDIPNTVERAMRVLAAQGVDMVNVHASGTIAMMEAAKRGLQTAAQPPLLIAVTQLTSTDEQRMQKELWIEKSINAVIQHYAENAKKAGLDGVVCSPLESPIVHAGCGDQFLTITPGVRFPDSTADDQARITTPEKARELGSDYIVVGRPITRAQDPVAAYERAYAAFVS